MLQLLAVFGHCYLLVVVHGDTLTTNARCAPSLNTPGSLLGPVRIVTAGPAPPAAPESQIGGFGQTTGGPGHPSSDEANKETVLLYTWPSRQLPHLQDTE